MATLRKKINSKLIRFKDTVLLQKVMLFIPKYVFFLIPGQSLITILISKRMIFRSCLSIFKQLSCPTQRKLFTSRVVISQNKSALGRDAGLIGD